MTDKLMNRLAERRRLIVIGEAQNLNRDCFEYLRHLHDDPATRGATVPASEMPAVVRARFEQLRAEEIVELEHRAYRASAIALYSSYRSAQASPGH